MDQRTIQGQVHRVDCRGDSRVTDKDVKLDRGRQINYIHV